MPCPRGRGFSLSFPQVFSGNPGSLFLVLLPLPTVGEGWGEGAKTLDARSGSGMTEGGKADEKRRGAREGSGLADPAHFDEVVDGGVPVSA